MGFLSPSPPPAPPPPPPAPTPPTMASTAVQAAGTAQQKAAQAASAGGFSGTLMTGPGGADKPQTAKATLGSG